MLRRLNQPAEVGVSAVSSNGGPERPTPNRKAWQRLSGKRRSSATNGKASTPRRSGRKADPLWRMTGSAWARLAVSFCVLAACSWLGIMLSHQSEGVATIWLSNGILFGLVMTRPRAEWIPYFLAGLLADTVADVVYGDPFKVALGVSLANSVEVILSSIVLTRWFGTPLNLAKRRPLIGFLLVAVVGAAALTSALGASWTLLFYPGVPWLRMWRTWYLGDMLGMALLAPLIYTLHRPDFFSSLSKQRLPRTLLVLLVPAATTVLVFTHAQDPLIFFLYPAILLVVFRLGFPGTVMAVVLVAFLSIGLTVKGQGPLMLIVGDHMMLHRIVVAQIFLAVSIFTMFPVAALLEEGAELQRSLAESEARQRQLANADDLTGLSNRRAFNLRLEQEWQYATAHDTDVALLLLDADLFKSYTALNGHLGGDECLRKIAKALEGAIDGAAAFAARFGGEEFAVILPGGTPSEAEHLAEEIRSAVVGLKVAHPACAGGLQTVSLGVATMHPAVSGDAIDLVRMADDALYQAKTLGRNQVVVSGTAM